jgi:putative tryptophan/tyrosine transport system substrate-binding protein
MRRREFIALVGGAAGWPIAAHAQQERMRRIGVLMGASDNDPETKRRTAILVEELGKLGWIDGRNVQFEYRITDDVARMRSYAAEIVDLAPDVIVAHSNPFLANLRQVNRTIPTVFVQIADPVGGGFVESLARPGGNLTGFSNFEAEIGGKWLGLLKQVAPRITRCLVLLHQETAANVAFLRAVEAVAPSLQVRATAAGVHNAAEIEQAIVAFVQEPDGGVIVIPVTVIGPSRDLIATLAARHRLPTMFPFRFWMATNGGLMSYGVDVFDLFLKSAVYVDHILRGVKPSDLPVQNPTKYELVINLKTAKALGLNVPATLLASANEVIE